MKKLISVALMVAGLGAAMQVGAAEQGIPAPVAAPAAGSPKQGETFSHDSLGVALEEMGFDVTPLEGTTIPVHQVAFSEAKISGRMRVELSPNQQNVWFTIFLTGFEKDQKIPAEILTALLDANSQGTQYFEMIMLADGGRGIRLTCSIPNHHVTRVHLRDQIKALGKRTAETETLWNTSLWKSGADLVTK